MSKRKLLFITEGEVDELVFIEKVFEKCYPNVDISIILKNIEEFEDYEPKRK